MSKVQRLSMLGVAVVVVIVAVVIALTQSGGKSAPTSSVGRPAASQPGQPPPPPAIALITVRNQQPVGGIQTIAFKKGQQVRFAVTSDSEQDIHVHGYDLHQTVPAGGTIQFSFAGTIDGSFVVELEKSSTQIANLKVTP